MSPQPVASRPEMAEYGLLPAEAGRGLLSWAWAVERLTAAHTYWFSTTRPDGRPHLMPIWGIWIEESLAFSTAGSSRKARNLARSPACAVALLAGEESIIVEGVATSVTAKTARTRILQTYREKYREGFPSDSDIYAVRPTVAFAFIDNADDFVGASTRWRFPT